MADRAQDVADLEAAMEALYAWISGPPGPRGAAGLVSACAPGARLYPLPLGDRVTALSPEEFVAGVNWELASQGFYERQLESQALAFGDLGHVWSAYETRQEPDGPVVARGVNSAQFVRQAGRWKLFSLAWDVERPERPLPGR